MSSVTALLPAWQAADFIQPTLNSLSAQTFADLKVIVSVDSCTDRTAAICDEHAARDPRFTVVRQSERQGYVGNCNALLGLADSDYVFFAFHDDTIEPTYVERLAAVLDARPEVVLSFSDILLTDLNGQQTRVVMDELEGERSRVKRGMQMLPWKIKWWVPNRGLFRLERARRIGGLKTHGAGEFSPDKPWLFHMSLLGEFARVPADLCFKYFKPGSMTMNWEFSPRQNFEVLSACMAELWASEISATEKLDISGPLLSVLLKLRAEVEGQNGK